jgi:flagellar biosynthesis protein FlhF
MKVKKYTAATMKDALWQIRQEMGEDALIISTREITAPLGKKFVEVTAAAEDTRKTEQRKKVTGKDPYAAAQKAFNQFREVEEPPMRPVPEPAPQPAYTPPAPQVSSKAAVKPAPAPAPDLEEQIVKNRVLLSESLKPLKEEIFQLRNLVDEMRRSKPAKESVDLEPLKQEMKGLKRMFQTIRKSSDYDALVNFSEPLKTIYHLLINNEVEEPFAYDLIEMADAKLDPEEKENPDAVRAVIQKLIEANLSTARPVILNQNRPTIMAFVGPTGVGKTTSIAKLAARCTLQMKKKVTLITIDTYRIAAVEQLKTYAKIMDLPIYVCYSPEEMQKTISSSADSSLILIDTAGHSQTDMEQVQDLCNYFGDQEDIEVLMVLSATTKSSDLKDISERFGGVGPKRLVFTKLDETTTYGSLLNVAVRTKLPIGYFTTGQNVPDDIETATPGKLAKLILGDN